MDSQAEERAQDFEQEPKTELSENQVIWHNNLESEVVIVKVVLMYLSIVIIYLW